MPTRPQPLAVGADGVSAAEPCAQPILLGAPNGVRSLGSSPSTASTGWSGAVGPVKPAALVARQRVQLWPKAP